MPNWKKIKAEYIKGGISQQQLADKYGVSISTLTKHAMAEKWKDLRKEIGKKTDEKIVEKVATQEAAKEYNVQSIADRMLEHIAENIDLLATNATSCKDITVALKNLRDIKGDMTERDIREQEAKIKLLEKQANADKVDNNITVTIEGGEESWLN